MSVNPSSVIIDMETLIPSGVTHPFHVRNNDFSALPAGQTFIASISQFGTVNTPELEYNSVTGQYDGSLSTYIPYNYTLSVSYLNGSTPVAVSNSPFAFEAD